MNGEIIAVGTELLLGNVVNTNASYLAAKLADLGINVYYQSVIGDNSQRLREIITLAFSRSDLIITTGGMGPTYDDLTKETIAEYFGVPLEVHQPSLAKIRDYFAKRPNKMTANNEKQALMPKGAIIFDNPSGTAPGCALEKDGKIAILLPGPPSEMQLMFESAVEDYLRKFSQTTLVSQTLYLFGIGESTVESLLKEMMTTAQNPTIAPYANNGEVLLRITAQAKDEAQGNALIKPVIDAISEKVGSYIYGINVNNLQTAVVQKLIAHQKTAATAESCTGGLISKLLTDIPGSSQAFYGGVCAYTNNIKANVLSVSPEILERYTAVSEQTALAMAQGVRNLLHTDYAVSTTGIAGPGGASEDQPVGLVYLAVVGENYTYTQKLNINFGPLTTRDAIRQYAAKAALYQLWRAIGQ